MKTNRTYCSNSNVDIVIYEIVAKWQRIVFICIETNTGCAAPTRERLSALGIATVLALSDMNDNANFKELPKLALKQSV